MRCKGSRQEPNSSSDEEEDETGDDEDEESDEEDLESSGDESTWTWTGCSSRRRQLKSENSHCKCNNCCTCQSFLSSHFETRHRLVGDFCVAGAKDCTTSCGGKGGKPTARDEPSLNPLEASGIFDTSFQNKPH